MKILTFAILMLTFNLQYAQKTLNLDFEYDVIGNNTPKGWYVGERGYKIDLDDKEIFSKERSLRMQSNVPTKEDFGVCTNSIPIEFVLGKTIEFKGRIKTHSVSEGYAGLWWRVDGKDKLILGFDNMSDRGLKGDNDWKEVSIEMKVSGDATKINFGALLTGKGTAWFDNFEIFINGLKFEDVEPKIIEPTKERQAWLRGQINPLQSFHPKYISNEDFQILDKLIGDTKVVALGEVTHGSSEIFQMKHRIIKYLTQNKGFNIFSIEANLPESYKINEYTFEGKGNPEELIRGMHFWTWRTQEVLEMVEWMKEKNKTKKKIQFTGFDMQYFNESLRELKQAFDGKPNLLKQINELGYSLEPIKENSKKRKRQITQDYDHQRIHELIENIKSAISLSSDSEEEKDWLLRNTRIFEQYLDGSYNSRDKYMAENVEWIQERNPNSKIAIWAHNEHIKKTDYSMGNYLSQSMNDNYLTIGFAFHKGKYTAVGQNGLDIYDAQESYAGTFEYIFQSINEPIFLLDLRKLKNDDSEHGQWIKENLEFRKVGAMKISSEFKETNLLEDFDLLIFINESTNSTLLK